MPDEWEVCGAECSNSYPSTVGASGDSRSQVWWDSMMHTICGNTEHDGADAEDGDGGECEEGDG